LVLGEEGTQTFFPYICLVEVVGEDEGVKDFNPKFLILLVGLLVSDIDYIPSRCSNAEVCAIMFTFFKY